MCGMEGRQEKTCDYRHTRAFLQEGVWTQQLSLKKTSMEAKQKITYQLYWGLCKDERFNNMVESGEIKRPMTLPPKKSFLMPKNSYNVSS